MALKRKEIDALLQNRPLALDGKAGNWTLYNVHSQSPIFKAKTLEPIRERITLLLGV